MTAFTDLDDLVNKSTGGASGTPETVFGWKMNILDGATAAPTRQTFGMYDMWRNRGVPNFGTVPGTVAAPTKATAGAIQGITNAGGTREKFITEFAFTAEPKAGLLLYDRLLHIGGLDGTVLTAQTVGGTITRNTGGEGNQIWVIHYGNTASSAVGVTASYTNQDGTGSRTTASVDVRASNAEDFIVGLPLQAGDTGVQSVQSITFASSATSTTEWGVVIAQPLLFVALQDTTSMLKGPYPAIEDDACLALASLDGYEDSPYNFGITLVES